MQLPQTHYLLKYLKNAFFSLSLSLFPASNTFSCFQLFKVLWRNEQMKRNVHNETAAIDVQVYISASNWLYNSNNNKIKTFLSWHLKYARLRAHRISFALCIEVSCSKWLWIEENAWVEENCITYFLILLVSKLTNGKAKWKITLKAEGDRDRVRDR